MEKFFKNGWGIALILGIALCVVTILYMNEKSKEVVATDALNYESLEVISQDSLIYSVLPTIFKTAEDLEEIKSFLKPLTDKLDQTYITFSSKYAEMRKKLTWKMDDDTQKTPGWKFHEWAMK